MRTEWLRFNGAVERDPAIEVGMKEHAGRLGAMVARNGVAAVEISRWPTAGCVSLLPLSDSLQGTGLPFLRKRPEGRSLGCDFRAVHPFAA